MNFNNTEILIRQDKFYENGSLFENNNLYVHYNKNVQELTFLISILMKIICEANTMKMNLFCMYVCMYVYLMWLTLGD